MTKDVKRYTLTCVLQCGIKSLLNKITMKTKKHQKKTKGKTKPVLWAEKEINTKKLSDLFV